jgi:serine/threonine-protein kinase
MPDQAERLDRLKAALADRYRLERELGQGGMATVYLAEDLRHDRKVAVKVLQAELAAVLGAERFVQEIKTTASLQHPHILPLFDSGEADSFLYYVMPYIAGETLRDKLNREKQLGIEEAVKITTEVADALDYAHRQDVIHRDIKPENILLHDGRPMVADFGIALAVSAAAGGRMTETGLSLGTPHYMSPEQATAEKDLTHKSDIYSLGAMLYEMLTGDPPHTGSSAQQIIAKIVTEEVPPVTNQRKSVPPNVAAAVAKALEKLPADRFNAAMKFAAALNDPTFLPLETRVSGRAARDLRSRLLVPTLTIVAVLVFTNLWTWRHLGDRAGPPSRQRINLGSGTLPLGGYAEDVALAPDGSTIAFIDTVGGDRVWLKHRGQADAAPVIGTDGAEGNVFFSPDGEWIGFYADGGLHKIPRAGGEPTPLTDSASRYQASWLESGVIVFTGPERFDDLDRGLFRMSGDGGPVERLLGFDDIGRGFGRVMPLPDGRGVLFVAWKTMAHQIWAYDFMAGRAMPIVTNAIAAWYVDGQLVYVLIDGRMFAAPFDLDALELTGPGIAIDQGIRTDGHWGDADVQLAGEIMLFLRRRGNGEHVLAWLTRDGQLTRINPLHGFLAEGDGGPVLSPDDSRVVFGVAESSGRHVWTRDLSAAGTIEKLTTRGSYNRRPAWSVDGRSIVFVGEDPDSNDVRTAFAIPADGSGPAVRILPSGWAASDAIWSNNEEWLVFRRGGGIFIYAPSADEEPRTLIDTDFTETSPALSPNDRFVAYVSDRSGQPDVYIRPFPNADDWRVQVSSGGGVEPVWSHSGRELFYKSESEGALMVATISADTLRPTVQRREVLFRLRPSVRYYEFKALYDVSQDDQRFIMFVPTSGPEEGAGELILVENFRAELREKVGN